MHMHTNIGEIKYFLPRVTTPKSHDACRLVYTMTYSSIVWLLLVENVAKRKYMFHVFSYTVLKWPIFMMTKLIHYWSPNNMMYIYWLNRHY